MVNARLLVGENRGRFPYSNSLLVEDGFRAKKMLVDLGAGKPIEDLVGSVDAVLLTHYHPDHLRLYGRVGGNTRVYAPAFDAAISKLDELAKRLAPGVWREWMEMAQAMGVPRELPAATPYRGWEAVEGLVETLPLPGHLYTHHGLVVGDCLYVSDVDLTGFGPWYGNPEASPERFIEDIAFIASLGPERLCTSHKEVEFRGNSVYEALARYASRVYERVEALLESMGEEPVKPRRLVAKGLVYPRIPENHRDLYMFFEEVIIEKTLGLAEGLGLVVRTRTGYLLSRSDWRERLVEEREKVISLIMSYA